MLARAKVIKTLQLDCNRVNKDPSARWSPVLKTVQLSRCEVFLSFPYMHCKRAASLIIHSILLFSSESAVKRQPIFAKQKAGRELIQVAGRKIFVKYLRAELKRRSFPLCLLFFWPESKMNSYSRVDQVEPSVSQRDKRLNARRTVRDSL